MKVAAIFALAVAFATGAWAINDYRNNEEVRRDFARQGVTYIDYRDDAGQPMRFDVQGVSDYYERRDAKVAALCIASLVISGVLYSRRKRLG